jgi:hypothetical protein
MSSIHPIPMHSPYLFYATGRVWSGVIPPTFAILKRRAGMALGLVPHRSSKEGTKAVMETLADSATEEEKELREELSTAPSPGGG